MHNKTSATLIANFKKSMKTLLRYWWILKTTLTQSIPLMKTCIDWFLSSIENRKMVSDRLLDNFYLNRFR